MTGRLHLRRVHCLALGSLFVLACGTPAPTEVADDLPSSKAAPAALTVSATDPSEAARDTTLDVRILGTGYDRSAQVTFLLDGQPDERVRTNATRFVSQTEVVANITIAADAIPDRYDVQVALSGGKKGIGTEIFLVQPILALNAGSDSYAYGVNSQGMVVGRYTRVGPCGSVYYQPFVWHQASGLVQLPLPPGYCLGYALAINESNVIVGWVNGGVGVRWLPDAEGNWTVERLGYATDGSPLKEAVDVGEDGTVLLVDGLWSASGGFTPLALAPAAASCSAERLGGAGQIAGTCGIGSRGRAVLWRDVSTAPVLLPDPPGALNTQARDANSVGVIVGVVTTRPKRTNVYRAVRWVPAADGSYVVEDLGTLGGDDGMAYGINEAGQVIGRSTVSGTNWNAFLWDPTAGMRNLGSTRVYGSTAWSISEPDAMAQVTIVGSSNAGATRWVQ